jgi:hypothetical protein
VQVHSHIKLTGVIMGKKYNEREKRVRRKNHIKRKKEKMKKEIAGKKSK